MLKFRIVPHILDYRIGKGRNVWKIQQFKGYEGFFFRTEIWKDVEWDEDLKLENPDPEDYRLAIQYRSYHTFRKYHYETETLAEAYIDKYLSIRKGDKRHMNIPPREYP